MHPPAQEPCLLPVARDHRRRPIRHCIVNAVRGRRPRRDTLGHNKALNDVGRCPGPCTSTEQQKRGRASAARKHEGAAAAELQLESPDAGSATSGASIADGPWESTAKRRGTHRCQCKCRVTGSTAQGLALKTDTPACRRPSQSRSRRGTCRHPVGCWPCTLGKSRSGKCGPVKCSSESAHKTEGAPTGHWKRRSGGELKCL